MDYSTLKDQITSLVHAAYKSGMDPCDIRAALYSTGLKLGQIADVDVGIELVAMAEQIARDSKNA